MADLGSEQHPIRCAGPSGERAYLDQLQGLNGEHLQYRRLGSMPSNGNMLDVYELQTLSGQPVGQLYFDMYHQGYEESAVPPEYQRIDEASVEQQLLEQMFDFSGVGDLKAKYGEMQIPIDSHGYVSSKASRLLLVGPNYYASQDYFNRPSKTCNGVELLSISSQYTKEKAGLYAEHPLKVSSARSVQEWLETFHFQPDADILGKFDLLASESAPMIITATHLMTEQRLSLYFQRL